MEVKCFDVEMALEDKRILKGIDMHIKDREFVGVIGPNGSGKSTLLKCIYRVLKPSCGGIQIDNEDIEKIPVRESAKKMAVVSQHNDYSFDFSVFEIVLMGRSPHKRFMERDNGRDFEIVRNSLEQVGMTQYENRSFSSLSGGERQRIILARALAQQSKCLILDEPTNHLDIKYQLEFMSIAKKLDITVISAIHDLNIASIYCDKIYALKDGKIVSYGTPKEVLTREMIKHLYDVDAEILEDKENGNLHIVYKPPLVV